MTSSLSTRLAHGRELADAVREGLLADRLDTRQAAQLIRQSATNSAASSRLEALHDAASIHLCPWHTCQATRHN